MKDRNKQITVHVNAVTWNKIDWLMKGKVVADLEFDSIDDVIEYCLVRACVDAFNKSEHIKESDNS